MYTVWFGDKNKSFNQSINLFKNNIPTDNWVKLFMMPRRKKFSIQNLTGTQMKYLLKNSQFWKPRSNTKFVGWIIFFDHKKDVMKQYWTRLIIYYLLIHYHHTAWNTITCFFQFIVLFIYALFVYAMLVMENSSLLS